MQTEKTRTWLTGAHIKWIAIITMVIDHIGAGFLEPMILNGAVSADSLYKLSMGYMVLRGIGRFAFPVFCFLLAEGFFYTKSRKKYLTNLLIFALISEVPFDWALFGRVIDWGHQNVFWTLFAGFVAIWIAEFCMTKSLKDRDNAVPYYIAMVAAVIVCAVLAEVIHADYGAVGVAAIFIMYAMHNKPVMGALFAWMMLSMLNWMEIFAFPFILAVMLYNKQRGKQMKYFFYVFYPAHLLIIAIVKWIAF